MHVYTLNYLLLSLSIFLVHTGCMSLAWRVLCIRYHLLVNLRVIMAAAIAPTLEHTRMPDGADVKQSARRPIAMRQMMAGKQAQHRRPCPRDRVASQQRASPTSIHFGVRRRRRRPLCSVTPPTGRGHLHRKAAARNVTRSSLRRTPASGAASSTMR